MSGLPALSSSEECVATLLLLLFVIRKMWKTILNNGKQLQDKRTEPKKKQNKTF